MAVELTTDTLTDVGGADGAVSAWKRFIIEEGRDRELCEVDSPSSIVVAVMVSCSVPPLPVRVAVTVIEYSVPSSRPVSVYAVSLPAMSGMVRESVKQ